LPTALVTVLTVGASPSLAAPILFGVSLNGHSSGSPGPSSLYTIDPVTGAGTLIGNIGYAVNAIAIDPTTGLLYGSTTSWSGAFNGLLQIDPLTGAGTEIGAFGAGFTSILALTFNSAGELFGWHDPSADDPVTINLATGAATPVGESGIGTAGHVMAFDGADVLRLVQSADHFTINTSTGLATLVSSLSFDPGAGGAAFDLATGLLWAPRDSALSLNAFIRVTDLAGNSFTDIDTDVEFLSALTWGETTVTVPEPATVLLLTAGLAGVARLRRRT
jgi:hypothetical protein